MRSETDKYRIGVRITWFIVVAIALVGWWIDKDISQLDTVIAWVVAALAIGEGANVGKRATWRKEAHDAETDAVREDA